MLGGWYLTGLLLPFGNVSKSSVESYFIKSAKIFDKNYKYRAIHFKLSRNKIDIVALAVGQFDRRAVSISMVVLKICRIVERPIKKGNDVR